MFSTWYLITLLAATGVISSCYANENIEVGVDDPELLAQAKQLLTKVDRESGYWSNALSVASWGYASNLTDENLQVQLNVSQQVANYVRSMYQQVSQFPWQNIHDFNIKRQFKKLNTPGSAVLPPQKYKQFDELISQMQSTYSKAKICNFTSPTQCDLALEPELTELMMYSRDPEELKHVWKSWRDESGKKIKQDFMKYVNLSNEVAKLNNYSDMAAFWKKNYESDNFTQEIEFLWQQIKPLYDEIHAYIRYKLRVKYGEKIVPKGEPIPAHLLGNMWAQTWSNIADFTAPFPNERLPDVTEAMVEQNYNSTKIFQVAENFFTSIDLSPMPETFWNNSILEKPNGVELICHASAWDFYDGKDFRIKQCTRINMEDLLTAHHEMGHIEYFLQYKNQPTVYKDGANPGFHEAIGDTISLSASTPEYLQQIGLIKNASTSNDAFLNHLFLIGLDKIVFLPFAYTLDNWRWQVFQSNIVPDTYNCEWWSLVEQYQGLTPPIERSENDFDPGAKYHIVADVEYIRYFVSFVIQFQFHKALCIEAGQYHPEDPLSKPLSQCNIYNNKKAGRLFKSMLEFGSSRPWQDSMEKVTGQRNMDASALLEYFEPLMKWLKEENIKNKENVGWKQSNKMCKGKH